VAQRRQDPKPIGATQTPDLDSDQLESILLERLEPSFDLEDTRICATSLLRSDAGSGRFVRMRLEEIDFGESKLRAVQFTDVVAERIEAANCDWGGAQLRRAQFEDSRLTGVDFAEARIEQVSFKGCKLDYANFRHSTLEHVSFEDCVLTGADFQGAGLEAVRFSGCDLLEADFSKAKLSRVDLRGSEIGLTGSLLALHGAIIDRLQLMELAPRLAHQLGIVVEDD
jgi:uncharacterized protein YjbI with pentapeptide repeats